MPEPIIFDQVQRDQYIELVCRMWEVPRTPAEVIEGALSPDWSKLLHHPLSNIHMQYAIFMRAAWTEAVLYGMANPELKHRVLLPLRDSYGAIQRLPKAWRDAFEPVFDHWAEVLNEEEERCNGTA